jgi:hypothetical protein
MNMKWLYGFIFVAYVHTPLGIDRTYKNVVSYRIEGMNVILILDTGKQVVAPALFTLVEEK